MGRSTREIIAGLPADRQAAINARSRELKQEVESLRELRVITGKAQADIAATLNIRQPSVSKMEKQAGMYLSTLRSYVEAVGGTLELTINLPERPPIKLRHLGEVEASNEEPPRRRKQAR